MAVDDSRHLQSQVQFYRLSRKFLDESEMPEEARNIMYYSLTIGHHLGVVDCLKSVMDCSGEEYRDWIGALPVEGDAFRKMKGYFTFGEITIFPEHINMLALAFDKIDSSVQSEKSQQLTRGFIDVLTQIHREPTMYLMIRSTR